MIAHKYIIISALWLAIGLMVSGCATKAPGRTESNAVTTVTDSTVTTVTEQQSADYSNLQSTVEDLVNKTLEKLQIVIEHTSYSPPDSSGNQHMTDRTTATINRETQNEQQKSTQKTDSVSATINTDRNTITEQITEKNANIHTTAETYRKLTWYQISLITLGVGVLLYIGYRLYRRKQP